MAEFNVWPDRFLTKLVETVIERGIGVLFPIWHQKRKTFAEAISEGDKLRILAQAQRDVKDIAAGELSVASSTSLKLVRGSTNSKLLDSSDRREPILDLEKLSEIAASIDLSDRIKHEINVTKALIHATRIAEQDPTTPSQEAVDSDWLNRWQQYAGSVSNEQLQELWGRVIAGEVKAPRTFSLRTLDFLRNLSTDEAELIRRFLTLVSDTADALWLPTDFPLSPWGVSDADLVALQSLGLISGAPDGINDPHFLFEDQTLTYVFGDRALIIERDSTSFKIPQHAWPLSRTMLELRKLCPVERNVDYVEAVGCAYAECLLKVYMADARLRPEAGHYELSNHVRLPRDSPS